MEPVSQPPSPDYGPPPDYSSWPAFQSAPGAPAPPKPKRSRLKTALGGAMLAGLLVIGGAATVFAADPSPSPSASPGVTTPGTPGTNGSTTTKGNCPHDQTSTDTTTSTDSSS